ncbi:hypothetical protein ACTMTU_29990 [Streptomyces sp. OZ13]|uniref:hypothetical protein n=1 Tax=Streptomyces sp. OZ13 TaxID=3452210 RepID=UPI003F8ADCEE
MPTSRLLWWGGIAAVACGAVLCVVGWYGVSGKRVTERPLPCLVSATVPGGAPGRGRGPDRGRSRADGEGPVRRRPGAAR